VPVNSGATRDAYDLSAYGFISNIVRLPGKLTNAVADVPSSVLKGLPLTSIRGLSPNNLLFSALDSVPIRVPYHSIIGGRGKGGNLDKTNPQSSDGVGPYWSSHLDGAHSELVVPDKHGAFDDPKAIGQMKRILKLHLAGGTAANIRSGK
jgi:hypothetical protein